MNQIFTTFCLALAYLDLAVDEISHSYCCDPDDTTTEGCGGRYKCSGDEFIQDLSGYILCPTIPDVCMHEVNNITWGELYVYSDFFNSSMVCTFRLVAGYTNITDFKLYFYLIYDAYIEIYEELAPDVYKYRQRYDTEGNYTISIGDSRNDLHVIVRPYISKFRTKMKLYVYPIWNQSQVFGSQ